MSLFSPSPSEAARSHAAGRILDAASKLFYERGIQAVGMDLIVKEAGVAINTLYKYFPSKDKLVEEYLLRRDARWLYWLTSSVNKVKGPRERLLAIFDALDEWFQSTEFRGCAFINAAGEVGEERAGITRVIREHKSNLYIFIKSVVKEAGIIDADKVTKQLMLLVEGAIINAQLAINPDAARCARETAELILKQH